MEELAGKIDR